jgi:hypothetical protein
MLHVIFAVHPHVHHFSLRNNYQRKAERRRTTVHTNTKCIHLRSTTTFPLFATWDAKYNTNIMLSGTEGSTGPNESSQNSREQPVKL